MGFRHAIPHIVERFIKLNHSEFDIYGYNQTRAFCYIDDAVRGTVAAMESGSAIGQIYHIGNDQEITMDELTKFIGTIAGYKGSYQKAVTYPGSVNRRCPDISKAKKELNYNPAIDWKEGVTRTVKWYIEFFSDPNNTYPDGFEPPEKFNKKMT